MAPLKAMLTESKALNDKCTGEQALNCLAGRSYCPSQDDSPKLKKNQFKHFFQFGYTFPKMKFTREINFIRQIMVPITL